MLKLLLVDDEQPILDGLKSLIDWDKAGIRHIETAANGREALAVAGSFKPDIIITDIKMPFMNGLELIRSIRQMQPESKCIVLCGYQDFEYAREAMKYGAVRYLVKPVEENELKEAIQNIRESYLSASREKERIADLNRKLVESVPFLRNKLLYSIITGEAKDADVTAAQLNSFGIKHFPDRYICAVIEFETNHSIGGFTGENMELIRFAAANITDELINAHAEGLVFYMLEQQIIIIMDVMDCQTHTVEALLRDVIHHISGFLKMPVTIGVSSVCEGIGESTRSFREAKSALKYKLLAGIGKAIYYNDMAGDSTREIFIPLNLGKRLENSVITGDSSSIPGAVSNLFTALKSIKGVRPSEILSKCREELLLIRRNFEDMGVSAKTISAFIERFDNELQGLTIDELELQFRAAFTEMANEILKTNTAGIKAIINQIRQYIDNNYEFQITLNTIAEKFYINSSYASRLFKQELSENFIDYLTGKRISEAIKMLLNTEMNVYEISEKIGYGNPKYFSQLFKKHTGMTPREYRDSIKNKE